MECVIYWTCITWEVISLTISWYYLYWTLRTYVSQKVLTLGMQLGRKSTYLALMKPWAPPSARDEAGCCIVTHVFHPSIGLAKIEGTENLSHSQQHRQVELSLVWAPFLKERHLSATNVRSPHNYVIPWSEKVCSSRSHLYSCHSVSICLLSWSAIVLTWLRCSLSCDSRRAFPTCLSPSENLMECQLHTSNSSPSTWGQARG